MANSGTTSEVILTENPHKKTIGSNKDNENVPLFKKDLSVPPDAPASCKFIAQCLGGEEEDTQKNM